jgi:hypothetical protein
MKKGLIFTLVFLALFGLSFVSSCSFGQTQPIGQLTQYCDLSGNWVNQKLTEGVCLNDFECTEGFLCLSDKCTSSAVFANVTGLISEFETLSSSCFNDGYFCYNGTIPVNSTSSTKNCSYAGLSASCYKCNTGFSWNETLKLCITGICNSAPGCLTNSSILNGTKNSNYCATGSCFDCDSDFEWNNSRCQLKQCASLPGCLDSATNNSLFVLQARNCSVGKTCFACKSGYVWGVNESQCVLSSGTVSGSWSTITFSDSEFKIGTTKALGVYDRVYFSFESRSYWVGLISILSNGVNVRVDPVISSRFLNLNTENKIDLNNDNIYDVKLILESVSGGKAYINIESISEKYGNSGYEPSPTPTPSPSPSPTPNAGIILFGDDATQVAGISLGYLIIIFSVVLIMLIILIIFFVVDGNKKSQIVSNVRSQSPNYQQPSSDQSITNEILRQLGLGERYLSEGKILPAKAIYSRISQLYTKLHVPNDDLYENIVKFFNKLS